MNKHSKIYIAGHRGMVGSAIVRRLKKLGFCNLIYRTRKELDLCNQADVQHFFRSETPEYVFLAAAKVGGILANNTYPAQFLYDNLMIEANIIHAAYTSKVKKLLFFGSSCIYPKMAPQPLKEAYLLTGSLEPTNEAYAIAKIAGIELCKFYRQQYGCDYISAMPTNLYGINDNFDLETSHVLPALIRKFYEAKKNNTAVELWGTGSPYREFLFVDDLADASIFLMQHYSDISHINVGTGEDITIKKLSETVQEIVGHQGEIHWNTDKPDGTPRKLLDVSRLKALGWKHSTSLQTGIEKTYEWFRTQKERKT